MCQGGSTSRNFAGTILVFVAGLGIGYFARRAGIGVAEKTDTHAADLAAIEKLHQEDVAVTLTQDPKGLMDVWRDDGIRINPGSPPVAGRQAIQADNEKLHAIYPEFKVLK
jgi:hypothetical protein